MILVIIGTKAQLIKTAPVISRLANSGLSYRFIWTGQHHETIDILLGAFNLQKPIALLQEDHEANTKTKLARWLLNATAALYRRVDLFEDAEVVLVHGDTVSTLLAAAIAKIKKVKVGHIEAGLRSGNIFDPFPEEIIRRLTSSIADIHYCPGSWAANNLREKKNVVDTDANTLLDSLNDTTKQLISRPHNTNEKYGIVSMHRFENISSNSRFNQIISSIREISNYINIKFVLHPATRERLQQTGLMHTLKETPNITLTARMDYPDFVSLLYGANFLITDGGSNQEEASYLGIPCLLLRKHTERQEGLDTNVVLSKLNEKVILDFAKFHANNSWTKKKSSDCSPSDLIVKDLNERFFGKKTTRC